MFLMAPDTCSINLINPFRNQTHISFPSHQFDGLQINRKIDKIAKCRTYIRTTWSPASKVSSKTPSTRTSRFTVMEKNSRCIALFYAQGLGFSLLCAMGTFRYVYISSFDCILSATQGLIKAGGEAGTNSLKR